MPLLAFALPSASHVFLVVLLVLGFGFVIFFHELGHFLAAKWVGIKVEQFAVGFGQALVTWRKGVGVRLGNTQKQYQEKLEGYFAHLTNGVGEKRSLETATPEEVIRAEKELGLGETEYRLNWIPLGGYVKMLGQDDLRPNSQAEDPRSYNKKSIGARMLVVSAGVIMNIILAGIGFMVLYTIGHHVPPAWVGAVSSSSPADNAMRQTPGGALAHAPLRPGDQILEFQGKPQADFTTIGLDVALSSGGQQSMKVRRVDGTVESILITPEADDGTGGFLSIGIAAPRELRGLDPSDVDEAEMKDLDKLAPPEARAVEPGETVTAINGHPVNYRDFWKLSEALQDPTGAPVRLTVTNDATKQTRETQIYPHFSRPFGAEPLSFAGMMPRPQISSLISNSPVIGKVMPGDVVMIINVGRDKTENPTTEDFREKLKKAGEDGNLVNLTVLRNGKPVELRELAATAHIDNGKAKTRGLGVGLGYDETHPVVSGTVKNSPADASGIPAGATITSIGDTKVNTWFDIQRLLSQAKPGVPVAVHYVSEGVEKQKTLTLNDEQIFQVKSLRHGNEYIALHEFQIVRKASNPIQAASWGVGATRDFILQFYLTLRRMVGGTVSPDQLMGPVGIFVGGKNFAYKGGDWLLWFLAMISANLAVVNFLPIPIVDGGLFTFLILEKIQGRPLSAKAQMIAQYVGLAFLAGVFLFVSYHDLVRLIG